MQVVINGITVTKEDGKIKFVYKDVPVTIIVAASIPYDDVVDLVVYECMDIDNMIDDA